MRDDGFVGNNLGRRRASANTADVAELFGVVSDHTRLALLKFVMSDEHCVTQCTDHIGLTHSAVSKQLNALADAGLVSRRPAGRRTYYRVSDPKAVTQILDAAGSLIAQRSRR